MPTAGRVLLAAGRFFIVAEAFLLVAGAFFLVAGEFLLVTGAFSLVAGAFPIITGRRLKILPEVTKGIYEPVHKFLPDFQELKFPDLLCLRIAGA